MPHFVISNKGPGTDIIALTTNFFQISFAQCLVVFTFKVSNNSDKYLPGHSIMKNCSESDVHHMTSQILSILIDFIHNRAFFVPFIGSFSNLYTLITLELTTILRNSKRQSF